VDRVSSDFTTGAGDAAPAATGLNDLSEASRRLLEETFNGGKLELFDQLVAPEAVNHDPASPAQMRELRGPEVFKRTVSMDRGAFPDVRIIVDDVIAADDKVVLRWHSEGTHRGDLAGLAPTGARASVTGIGIDRWKDGKVVEVWTEWDNLGLARQLGAAPPEGSVGEKIGMGLQRVMARWMRKKNQG
jgi:predicted ester cyclase